MKIIITESQYKMLSENFDEVLDLYSKMKKGEELKPFEKDMLKSFKITSNYCTIIRNSLYRKSTAPYRFYGAC